MRTTINKGLFFWAGGYEYNNKVLGFRIVVMWEFPKIGDPNIVP